MAKVKKADFHVHTTASDGLLKPWEVVLQASRRVSTVAITDHDTVQGLPEATRAGLQYNVSVIPGIELSCYWRGKECHLLGYHMRVENTELLSTLKKIKAARRERMENMLTKLQKLGLHITWEDLLKRGERTLWGRPHLAQAMVEKKLVGSISEAFVKYLEKGRPAYVERWRLNLQEAVKIIKNAGGFPVLAHPGKSGLIFFLSALKQLGIEGVEAYHPEHTLGEVKQIVRAAYDQEFYITGGSDFHGHGRGRAPFVGFIAVQDLDLHSASTWRSKGKRKRFWIAKKDFLL